jgi:spore germination protein KA
MKTIFKGLLQGKKTKEAEASQFTGKLDNDENTLRQLLNQCNDVTFRKIDVPALNRRALVVLVGSLVNQEIINRDIITRLLSDIAEPEEDESALNIIGVGDAARIGSIDEAGTQVLMGKTLVLVDGSKNALLFETRQWPSRSVEEPFQEQVIQGPREGFTEVITINMGLVRRRLPTPALKMETLIIGRRTKNTTALIYMDDIADKTLVDEARRRLKAIDIDGISEPGAIGELISERVWSVFPLYLTTERPDKVSAALLQGKIVIIADTSPFAYVIPSTFSDFNQSPDDYYVHPVFATVFRLIRLASFGVATTFTAAYVAVVSFHYEMLPRNIVTFIAETRVAVPFAPLTEALLLEGAVELIRETSLRLPKPLAGTIGIVGALVLGQAAVTARLFSPILLIIVAISFLSGFAIPNYNATLPLRYIRFPMLVAAGVL